MNSNLKLSAILATVGMASLGLSQVIVFNNLGNPPAWDTTNGWTVSGLNDGQTIYMPFTSSASGVISEVDAAITLTTNNSSGGMYANLWSSSGGAPGTLLSSSNIRNDGNTNALDGFVFQSGASLAAGNTYYIQLVTTSTADAGGGWNWVTGDPNVPFYFTVNGSSPIAYTGTESAFRVFVAQAVPEPTSLGALALGAVGLLARKRKK